MPNIKSAKKRLKQSLKRRESNRKVKSTLSTYLKEAELAIAGGDRQKAEEAVRKATRKLDTTAQQKVIHPNKAARKKSRLHSKFNSQFAS